MATSKTPVTSQPLRLKLERFDEYEERARILNKTLLPHEGFPRENNGDWIILEENGERFGTVTFKSRAKRGETWNAPDPEGQRRAELVVCAVNCHQELLEACKDLEKTAKEFAGLHSSGYLNSEKYRHDAWKAMLESVIKTQTAILRAESGS